MCLIKITLGKKHLVWIEKKSAQEKNKQTNKQLNTFERGLL